MLSATFNLLLLLKAVVDRFQTTSEVEGERRKRQTSQYCQPRTQRCKDPAPYSPDRIPATNMRLSSRPSEPRHNPAGGRLQ